MSTVAGIIDGVGNLGSAIAQSIIGFTVTNFGYQYGFLLFISIDISATIIPLSKILYEEIKEIIQIRKRKKYDR